MTAIQGSQVAQVLFLDMIAYSRESTQTQARWVTALNEVVNGCEPYQAAQALGQVLVLPTGDGMALIFWGNVTSAVDAAVAIQEAAKGHPELKLRLGLHSGLVQSQASVHGSPNVVGEGINTAQRVMDLGAEGQILLTREYAQLLKHFAEWAPRLMDLGEATSKHGQKIHIFDLLPEGVAAKPDRARPAASNSLKQKICVLYKRNTQPDNQVMEAIERHLTETGHEVFIDRHMKIGVEWATAIEERIRTADAVIAIVSPASAGSEMLEYELEIASEQRAKTGQPKILPVRINESEPLTGPLANIINPLNYTTWQSQEDTNKVLRDIDNALAAKPDEEPADIHLEPCGGAVPLESPMYLERATDHEFKQALIDHESILLVKGPRQMGKTSLIARGVVLANQKNWRIANLDFQKLSSAQLGSDTAFYRLVAATLGRQLGFKYDFANEWLDEFGPNMNLDFFMRSLLESSESPLVWFMDEADRLFGLPFASDFFGLIRSWHNSRAMEPTGPWHRLSVVIGYATEAHLFIQDLNQSPFNVGRHILLQNFTPEQFAELNNRHGSPIPAGRLDEVYKLVGGQPFLVRRSLEALANRTFSLDDLITLADTDEGPFGDHLKRVLIAVSTMPQVLAALQESLHNPAIKDSDGFYRLLAAGVVTQGSEKQIQFRNELYKRYLAQHL